MHTKVKIILRAYPKTFEWESLEEWEKRINDFVEYHDVVEMAPIGMDGVMVRYHEYGPELQSAVENVGVTSQPPPDWTRFSTT